jgi:hypothetical protein
MMDTGSTCLGFYTREHAITDLVKNPSPLRSEDGLPLFVRRYCFLQPPDDFLHIH